jgi:hypothetical protein
VKKVANLLFIGLSLLFSLTASFAQVTLDRALVYRSADGAVWGLPWEIEEGSDGRYRISLQKGRLLGLRLDSQLENGEWISQDVNYWREGLGVTLDLSLPQESVQNHLYPLPPAGALVQGTLALLGEELPLPSALPQTTQLGRLVLGGEDLIIPQDLVLPGGDLYFPDKSPGAEIQLLWQSAALPVPIVLYTGPARELPVYSEGGEDEVLLLRLLEGKGPVSVEFRPKP